jgi:uncharacterized protein YuzE
MLRIEYDDKADAVYIQWLIEPIGCTNTLDHNRLVDYTLPPARVVGVDLMSVSEGVKLKGLPNREAVKDILNFLKIKTLD